MSANLHHLVYRVLDYSQFGLAETPELRPLHQNTLTAFMRYRNHQWLIGINLLQKTSQFLRSPSIWLTASLLWWCSAASAQLITPALDGTGTVVTPQGDQFDINGGQRSSNGTNLFHSFQQFGLNPTQIANFLASPGIQNILGRVVGGEASVINGRLQVTGANANLFLMNPAGIVFGPNASLNVPAAFTATTANSIGFGCQVTGGECGGWWNAVGASDYLNLVGNPQTFAFPSIQPGAIINAGNLAVGQGQSLSLLGGTLVNTGTLTAPEGTITVVAVPGENLVRVTTQGSLLSLEFSPLAAAPGTIATPPALPQLLTGGTLASATGLTVDASGQVILVGSNQSLQPLPGSISVAGTLSTAGQTGGTIHVLGDRVALYGATLNASGSGKGGTVLVGGDYQGQGTVPNATRTYVSADSHIQVDSLLNGQGGRAIVWANEATAFYGHISAQGGVQSGNGGFVEVSGKQNLTFQGRVSLNAPQGLPGTLLLDPRDINIVAGVGADDATVTGSIFFADGGNSDFQIGANRLATIASTGNVIFQATRDINLFIPITLTGSPGTTISFTADRNFNGAGQSINTPGRTVKIRTLTGDIFTGNIDTRDNVNNAGAIHVQANGHLHVGDLNADQPNGVSSPITLQAGGNLTTGYARSVSLVDLVNPGNSSGGTITLEAGGAITVTGNLASWGSFTSGDIKLLANKDININCTSTNFCIETFSGGTPGFTAPGNSGKLTITSTTGGVNISGTAPSSLIINTAPGSTGDAGDIKITASKNINIPSIIIGGSNATTALISETGSVKVQTLAAPSGTQKNAGNIDVQAAVEISVDQINTVANFAAGGGVNLIAPNVKVNESIKMGSLTSANSGPPLIINSSEALGLTSAIATNGADIVISSVGNLEIANVLNSSSSSTRGGNITLTSSNGSINTNDLTTTGVTRGGDVQVLARSQITTGNINTSATIGNGGRVTLDPLGDVQVGFINAQGGIAGIGGNVDIFTQQFFRSLNTFSDRTGIAASIGAGGGIGGGNITITHAGGSLANPFTVGQPLNPTTGNGTLGAITTNNNVILTGFFPGPYRQFGPSGNIALITTEPPRLPEQKLPEALDDQLPDPCRTAIDPFICGIEEYFTRQYERILGLAPTSIKSLEQIQQELREVEQATGVKPALIYAFFAPHNVRSPRPLPASSQLQRSDRAPTQPVAGNVALEQQSVDRTAAPIGCNIVKESEPIEIRIKDQTGQIRILDRFTMGELCQLEVVLVTANGAPIAKRISNSLRSEVINRIKLFNDSLSNKTENTQPRTDYKRSAQQLYTWLIAELQADLRQQGITNLTFIMDDGLRNIPIAALHDGQSFLVQQYSLGLMPSMSLTDTRYVPIRTVQALPMGASDFPNSGLRRLPAAPIELKTVATIWTNPFFINQEFTLANLKEQRNLKPYGLIHLATHADFQPNRPQSSYIQLWDGRLPLNDIRTLGWATPPVELLILSACRTAFGDNIDQPENPDKMELGFSGLAVQVGVKSSIGSLWYVGDQATLGLMTALHQWLKPQSARIKAEALQKAQIEMLTGQVFVEGDRLQVGNNPPILLPPGSATRPKEFLTDPNYWAAFTLVGNPW